MSLSALQPFMDSLVSEIQQLRSAIGAVQLDADSAGLASQKFYMTCNPFNWMESISLEGKTDFFSRRVGEYQKAGIMSTVEERQFSIDAEF